MPPEAKIIKKLEIVGGININLELIKNGHSFSNLEIVVLRMRFFFIFCCTFDKSQMYNLKKNKHIGSAFRTVDINEINKWQHPLKSVNQVQIYFEKVSSTICSQLVILFAKCFTFTKELTILAKLKHFHLKWNKIS